MALVEGNTAALKDLCDAVKASGNGTAAAISECVTTMTTCMGEIRDAIASDGSADRAETKALIQALGSLRPHAPQSTAALERMIGAFQESMTNALTKIAQTSRASNDAVTNALGQLADAETRELKVEMKDERKPNHGYTFEFNRDQNGNLTSVEATPKVPYPIPGVKK